MSNHIRPVDGENASSWKAPMVTLTSGRQVPSDSEEWRAECFYRERHTTSEARTLIRITSKAARREALEKIRQTQGDEVAERIEARTRKLWAAEKSKAKSCTPG